MGAASVSISAETVESESKPGFIQVSGSIRSSLSSTKPGTTVPPYLT